jgi:phosphatidylinositol-3-phosphatase
MENVMLFARRTRVLSGIALFALAACNNSNGMISAPSAAAANSAAVRPVSPQTLTTKYVQLLIFENRRYDEVIGSPKAPYLNSLAQSGANMTQSFAVRHPSEPNYVALFSGSTEGLHDDACPRTYRGVNLGSQLLDAGISFLGYAESMPSRGFEGCQATPKKHGEGFMYRRKHNPWADFTKVPLKDSMVYDKPFTKPPAQFVWITPNMCNDMHDCGIAIGDRWASKNLPKLIAWDQANNGVLIITFDENDGSPGNQIPTILVGNVNPGQYSQTINHYNMLRTIEDLFGLKPVNNAKNAEDIQGVIK